MNEIQFGLFLMFFMGAVFTGFNLKIYTEIMKEKSQRRRKQNDDADGA